MVFPDWRVEVAASAFDLLTMTFLKMDSCLRRDDKRGQAGDLVGEWGFLRLRGPSTLSTHYVRSRQLAPFDFTQDRQDRCFWGVKCQEVLKMWGN